MPNVKNLSYIFLFTALVFMSSCAPSQSSTPQYAPPVKSTESNTPFPSLTLESSTTAEQPPACTFPLAQITTQESTPEEYTFSEPQVVLIEPNPIDIVEWLPDNQHVLIVQYIPNNNQQSIELFNPQSNERHVYAIRNRIDEPPSWLPESNAVIYPAMNIIRVDKIKHSYEFTRQMWISEGDPKNAQLVADSLLHFYIAVKPGRSQIAYLSDKQLAKRNASLEVQQPVTFDSTQWEYRRSIFPSAIYKMAWRPDTSQVFLYSNGDTGGYTFLLDTDTGEVCEINLGSQDNKNGWAEIARWSPNGRYLAIVRSWGTLPINFSDLGVLDVTTGKLYTMQVTPKETSGRHFVKDIAWAPDSHHVVAIGSFLPFPGSGQVSKTSGLYLIDFASGQNIHLLPSNEFSAGWPGTNLSWSMDGSNLLVRCPTAEEERLCLISVQRNEVP